MNTAKPAFIPVLTDLKGGSQLPRASGGDSTGSLNGWSVEKLEIMDVTGDPKYLDWPVSYPSSITFPADDPEFTKKIKKIPVLPLIK
ncbi:hypothetical protein [Endozoicomonas sp. SCSIO W0465]|uniref:hypothetical protein n=1 Tax=Endozoicomonas sp. SCSIO W0465 TaxID=2918516 RepID=UPI0020760049|nr:hypothetical protein [Endozoicomonas sp. SCSIO W0465]USE34400.1 hypothetical protein MJO57_19900 [Endozoicomonas sp. SCSIO W0465]